MLYSKLFGKTLREAPREAVSANARFLIRGGFVDQVMAGAYSWLPLGLRVLRKVEKIVREEMNALGAEELLLSALQPKENWQKTSRWKEFDALYKIKSRTGQEIALGPTHEEVITPLVRKFVSSYRDLPIYLYQIQTKFRDELRSKAGVLRGREFGMKDLYSFHKSREDLDKFYPRVLRAYQKIFRRCGLDAKITTSTGGTFSPTSDEFQVIAQEGEDKLFYCKKCQRHYNEEIVGNTRLCPDCRTRFKDEVKGIEVGNTFRLGKKFAEVFNLEFTDEKGNKQKVVMGCYGIGTTRLVGAIVESSHDERGILWPTSVAPYQAHLVRLDSGEKAIDGKIKQAALKLYKDIKQEGIELLYDERSGVSAGEKFTDADLIGIPWRIVISERTLEKKSVEFKQRAETKSSLVKLGQVLKKLSL